MEDPTRMELPGFSTPGHPKVDDRLFSAPDGSVAVLIGSRVPKGSPMPNYICYLSTEYGRFVKLQLTARTGQILTIPNGDDTDQHVLKITPDLVQIFPGTYRLRVLVDGVEVLSRSLTIENHPALP